MKKEIGATLKTLRENKKLKQSFIAHKLGVTIETYANIEHGRVDVNSKKLKTMAAILGIKASCIISLAEELLNFQEFI